MKSFSASNPNIPYYGNALDNEIIAFNLISIDEDVMSNHYYPNENKTTTAENHIIEFEPMGEEDIAW